MELRKEVEDLRRENEDLFDKLYVRQVVADLLQRVVMPMRHESDLKYIAFDNEKNILALKLEYEVKLADEMTSRERFSKELETFVAAYKQKQLEVELLQEELAAVTWAFDDKVYAEVASVTVVFNNKLTADHLDGVAHKIIALDGYDNKWWMGLRVFEYKLAAKITDYNKVLQEYKVKYQKLKDKFKDLKK